MIGDSIVKDFQALIKIKAEIAELKATENKIRENLRSYVNYLQMPISHDGWTASLRTNGLRVNVNWPKIQKKHLGIFIYLVMNGLVKFSDPTEETSLVFGKIKERKK